MPELSSRHPVLVYTAARVALFGAAYGLLRLTGLRGFLLIVAALLVSGLVSLWLLARQRDGVALAVTRRLAAIDRTAGSEDAERSREP